MANTAVPFSGRCRFVVPFLGPFLWHHTRGFPGGRGGQAGDGPPVVEEPKRLY